MAEDESGEKTEEPTGKKLSDARGKGDFPRSQDVSAVSSLTLGIVALMFMLGTSGDDLVMSLRGFIAYAGQTDVTSSSAYGVVGYLGRHVFNFILVVGFAAGLGGVIGNIMQNPPMITFEKIKPELSKINPIKGFKKLFAKQGLIEFLKGAVKLTIMTGVIMMVAKPKFISLEHLARLEPLALLPLLQDIAVVLCIAAMLTYASIAIVDYIHQRFAFRERMRMTKTEVKEEHKTTEGDPQVKAKLRQIRNEKSQQRMMANVPDSTVVVTNPTHFAVALKYEDDSDDAAPTCVAKGVDQLAFRIREVAEDNDVPVIEDPPLARALYATVEIDEQIPPDHYQAVAKIIGFVFRQKAQKAKSIFS